MSIRLETCAHAVSDFQLPLVSSHQHLFPPGVELFHQGVDAIEAYFICRGILKLIRSEENGEEILVGLRFPGSLVGCAAVVSGRPHPCSAVTATVCDFKTISSQRLRSLISEDALFSARLNELLSEEILDLIGRMSHLTCVPARQRLEHFLFQLCSQPQDISSPPNRTTKVQLPLKHFEIAELLSITPTYLCRLLNELETEGLITRSKGWIIVTRPSAFWHVLDLESSNTNLALV